jgi:hypothetical protein
MADITTYTLMNKNTPVLECKYDVYRHAFTGEDNEIIKYDLAAAPLGAFEKDTSGAVITVESLNDWLDSRTLDKSRRKVVKDNRLLTIDVDRLREENHALSMSDQYWHKEESDDSTWPNINYFTNPFDETIGDVLFKELSSNKTLDKKSEYKTPEATTGGTLRKKWKIDADGQRLLVKGGTKANGKQEPFNELIATKLYKRLLQPQEYVEYKVVKEDNIVASLCPNMLTPDTELIPAAQIFDYYQRWEGAGRYDHMRHAMIELGQDSAYVDVMLSKMLLCDALMANYDRHLNNFGAIRDVNTLDIKGFAPFWDNGNALYCNERDVPVDPWSYDAKPFTGTALQHLSLIKDLSWYEPKRLQGFDDEIAQILSDSGLEMKERRISAVIAGYSARNRHIDKIAHKWQLEHNRDHIYVQERPSSLKTRGKAFAVAEEAQAGGAERNIRPHKGGPER